MATKSTTKSTASEPTSNGSGRGKPIELPDLNVGESDVKIPAGQGGRGRRRDPLFDLLIHQVKLSVEGNGKTMKADGIQNEKQAGKVSRMIRDAVKEVDKQRATEATENGEVLKHNLKSKVFEDVSNTRVLFEVWVPEDDS